MSFTHTDLRTISNFERLIPYLEENLDWPLKQYGFDDLTFEYSPAELGLKDKDAVKVRGIHQLRPLQHGQLWGIFFVEFEQKKLPVVVLRRILSHLVVKKRASANQADAAAWQVGDLLFISAFGDSSAGNGEIAFAHFHQQGTELPTLRVLGWDGGDTPLKLEHVDATLRDKLRWPDAPGDSDAWRAGWSQAFRHRPGHTIRTADALAEALATLARRIRAAALLLLAHETEQGALRTLYKAFQTALIHDLSEADFADTYAQTITYGLLTAAISRTDMSEGGYGTALIADNITDMVPITNPFLREMLQTFLQVGGRKRGIDFDELGIQDVVELLRGEETDLPAVLRDFGNKTQGEDPVIHFYEHFLTAYDKKLKVQRGVFYTPKPVVSYIVRSVHELLQTEFGLADGLADTTTWGEMAQRNPDLKIPEGTDPDSPFVVILDPATGTATFLVEVVEVIHRTLTAKWQNAGLNVAQRQAAWNEYVPQYLLPRLHGYELMMAPYAIAHMKMGLKLNETGYRFASEERVRIYLTNALEPWVRNPKFPEFEAIAHEATVVNEIKRHKRFTVVIGNPPYAYASTNTGKFISGLIEEYYYVDGFPLNERNPRGLQDDYVKFIRFGQAVIQNAACGVMGYITNHSYIDNPTFPGMRRSFSTTFQEIVVLDLHGNTKKGERCPDGGLDNNVFDIQQGVVITIASASSKPHSMSCVSHAELWGTRELKYRFLASHTVSDTSFSPLELRAPNYYFVPQNYDLSPEYESGWSIRAMMPTNSVGIVTSRDELAVHFSKQVAKDVISRLVSQPQEAARKELQIGPDSQDWALSAMRDDLRKSQLRDELFVRFAYRPFDVRWTFYTGVSGGFHGRPRREVMQHMLPQNVGLLTSRMTKGEEFAHTFVTKWISEKILLSPKTSNNCFHFPLYLYMSDDLLGSDGEKVPNYAPDFVKALCFSLGLVYDKTNGLPASLVPEDIFHYAYAVFHSPGYRSRYAEFLKIDFPRLPLTSSLDLFRALARLGSELVALHLVEFALEDEVDAPAGWPRYRRLAQFSGSNRVVEKFPAANKAWQDDRVATNSSSGFSDVPEAVWNFHIGGYQVCHKWLKDRQGRSLSDADILHYCKIVTALNETIRLMAEIDEVIEEYGGWPIQ